MAEEPRVLESMSLGDILDESFHLYRHNFFTYVGIALIPTLLATVLTLLLMPEMYRPSDENSGLTSQEAYAQLGSLLERVLIAVLLNVIAIYLTIAALTKAVADPYLGRSTSILSAYAFVLTRTLPYFATLLLVGLLYLLTALPMLLSPLFAIFTIVAMILLTFMTSFVSQTFVVEDLRYSEAISRSRSLARQNWGRIFLLLCMWTVLSFIFAWGLEGLARVFFGDSEVLSVLLQSIGSALVTPVPLAAFVLLYFDIRVRKEGFDLQLLAQELAARGAPTSAPPASGGEPPMETKR